MTKQNDILKSPRASVGPQRSKASHEAILDAAEELLREGGVGSLSFESIARRAKAGKSTIYRWWPNKTALLLEMYERRKKREVIFQDHGNLRDDLTSLTKSLWSFWRKDNAGTAFAVLVAEAQFSDDTQKVLAAYFNDSDIGMSVSTFEKAKERGEILESVNLMELKKAYVAMNWFHLLCGRLEDESIEPAVNLLLDGFLARK